MKKKFDPIAFLIAVVVSLAVSIVAAYVYKLNLSEVSNLSFFSLPMYVYIFFMHIGVPLYFWVRYFRTNKKLRPNV
jgi:Kef-type K+ transport system membrane component KefB